MGSPDTALLSINTTTLRSGGGLPDIVAACARHGVRYIAPTRDHVQAIGVKDAARRIRDNGLSLSSYCRAGMFPAADRAARKATLDDNRRAVDEALTLGAPCLVVMPGGLPAEPDGTVVSKDLAGAREMVRDGLGELLDYARSAGMPLALEPCHPMYTADRGCVTTMAHANDLCDELGAGLGIAVDVYQVWWDRDLPAQIERAANATPSRLLLYQISDWLATTTHLHQNRGMMGDGVIDLPLVRKWMEDVGYRGPHEVEILSAEDWWKRDVDEVLLTCKFRHAEMT